MAGEQTKATSCSWLILPVVLTDTFEKTNTRLFGKVSASISVLTRIIFCNLWPNDPQPWRFSGHLKERMHGSEELHVTQFEVSNWNLCNTTNTGIKSIVFTKIMLFYVVAFLKTTLATSNKLVQSNLDYLDLDYPDFSIIRTFPLVPIWSWIFISHDQDP